MIKTVFSPREIVDLTAQRVTVKAPEFNKEEPQAFDVYEGPTAEDLRREAEAFKEFWEKEKAQMMESAQREAESIIRQAEERTEEEAKAERELAGQAKTNAEEEAKEIIRKAEEEAQSIQARAQGEREGLHKESRDEGFAQGREEGWKEGHEEVERLVERIHKILNTAIARRQEIVDEVEIPLIDLVLLMTRKVVKVISEGQKNIVIQNILQALKKLKSRGDVAIRVHLADLELTTKHTKEFISLVENVKSITVLEDSSVDRGGALIETDFGQIDARIASQLKEIEERILGLKPIKSTEGIDV